MPKKTKEFAERRKHLRYQTLNRLQDIKIVKEKDKDGIVESFLVVVERGGHSVKHRFPDMKSAFVFVRDFDHTGDSPYDRKHSRVYSLNIIYFEYYDKDGDLIGQGMGRTLNISKGGILLETYIPLDTDYTLSLSIDTELDLIMDIRAKPVFCKAVGGGKFKSGIQFLKTNETAHKIVEKHIKALKNQIIENQS